MLEKLYRQLYNSYTILSKSVSKKKASKWNKHFKNITGQAEGNGVQIKISPDTE